MMDLLLLEYNYKDLIRGVDTPRKERAKKRPAYYAGLFDDEMRFHSTGTSKWNQRVKLLDLEDALKLKGMTLLDRCRLAINGDIKVNCTCPDFLFSGRKYIGTQLGYSIEPENRFPKIRNRNLEGTVCKHLVTVLQVLAFHANTLVKDIKNSPKYKKYVPVQESFDKQFFPMNEDRQYHYEAMGCKFSYLPTETIISRLHNRKFLEEQNLDKVLLVYEDINGKMFAVSGKNVLEEGISYKYLPIMSLGHL